MIFYFREYRCIFLPPSLGTDFTVFFPFGSEKKNNPKKSNFSSEPKSEHLAKIELKLVIYVNLGSFFCLHPGVKKPLKILPPCPFFAPIAKITCVLLEKKRSVFVPRFYKHNLKNFRKIAF